MSDSEQFEATVGDLAYGGDGVVRVDGKAGFVPGALPGERVVAQVIQDKKRFSLCALVRVVSPSASRRGDDCPHERDGCGGCGFRHVQHSAALALKTEAAMSSVRRLARDLVWPQPSLRPVTAPDGQRTRVRFHAEPGAFGLYRRGTHELLEIPDCLTAHARILEACRWLNDALRATPEERPPNTVLIELVGEELTISWFGETGTGQLRELSAMIDAGRVSAVRLRARGEDRVLGSEWSEEAFEIAEHPLVLARRIGTFAQANVEANSILRNLVYAALSENRPARVLELYAGSGNLTLPISLACGEVMAVEVDPIALEGLRHSVELNQVDNIKPYERDLQRGFTRKMRDYRCDTILLDPPRSGAAECMEDILRSEARDVLYISCSPPHLARDAKALAKRYDVEAVDAIDMFPRTAQVELIARFRRRE